MKCKACHKMWDIDENKIYLFCPFCQEPLINITENIETLESALNYLTSHFGIRIYEDKQTVLKFLDTFLTGKKRERNFLNMAYAGGFIKSVLATLNDTSDKQRIFIQQAVDQLQEIYGISEDWANYVMNSVASSLGIEFTNVYSGIQKQLQAENGDIHINTQESGKAILYNMSGICLQDFHLQTGKNILNPIVKQSGIYLLKIYTNLYSNSYKIIIK